ncbi:MAG: carbohydrate kinase [Solobacterium sp.]|nr:carbohydrate kinase [Solobacterium sp.]
MKRYDVIALGELLIDFVQNGYDNGNPVFSANPGGAPCNVLAMLNKLGYRTAFIGKVGEDIFGRQLRGVLNSIGIDTTGLAVDPKIHTTLAFVEKKPDGDRDFSFYREPGADMMLREDEVSEELIKDTRIFHFGTLSLTHEENSKATKKAVRTATEYGVTISFDPNLREPLWNSLQDAWKAFDYGLRHCDILKISDNEILWFTGKEDYDEALAYLRDHYGIKLILLTLGKEGSRAVCGNYDVTVPGFVQANTVDTTGAGDTFMGSSLSYLLEHDLNTLTEEELKEMLTFANAAASIVTTRKGALLSMPERAEVEALIKG